MWTHLGASILKIVDLPVAIQIQNPVGGINMASSLVKPKSSGDDDYDIVGGLVEEFFEMLGDGEAGFVWVEMTKCMKIWVDHLSFSH